MSENTTFTNNMDAVFTDLHNFVKTDSILGTPMPIGDKTLVPVMSVTLGYGNADMAKKAQTPTNNGSGIGGLGARISADAVVVIEKDSVNMLNVGEKNNMNQLMDKLPDALTNISQNMMTKGQGNDNTQNQQTPQQGQQKQSSQASR